MRLNAFHFICSPSLRMTESTRFSPTTMPSRLSSRLIRQYDRVGKVGVSEANRDGFEG